jgi:hypothetical protein
MRNAPLWPALACCVRAVQTGLTRLRPFCWIARPDGRGLNTLLVPHAKQQQPQRHARQEAASAIGQAPTEPDAFGGKVRQQASCTIGAAKGKAAARRAT